MEAEYKNVEKNNNKLNKSINVIVEHFENILGPKQSFLNDSSITKTQNKGNNLSGAALLLNLIHKEVNSSTDKTLKDHTGDNEFKPDVEKSGIIVPEFKIPNFNTKESCQKSISCPASTENFKKDNSEEIKAPLPVLKRAIFSKSQGEIKKYASRVPVKTKAALLSSEYMRAFCNQNISNHPTIYKLPTKTESEQLTQPYLKSCLKKSTSLQHHENFKNSPKAQSSQESSSKEIGTTVENSNLNLEIQSEKSRKKSTVRFNEEPEVKSISTETPKIELDGKISQEEIETEVFIEEIPSSDGINSTMASLTNALSSGIRYLNEIIQNQLVPTYVASLNEMEIDEKMSTQKVSNIENESNLEKFEQVECECDMEEKLCLDDVKFDENNNLREPNLVNNNENNDIKGEIETEEVSVHLRVTTPFAKRMSKKSHYYY